MIFYFMLPWELCDTPGIVDRNLKRKENKFAMNQRMLNELCRTRVTLKISSITVLSQQSDIGFPVGQSYQV